ncbi:MAG: PilN domain-containing protein [Desulfobacteraceae bacterium]|nr:PilN domain-containing protein [Desulfobacteraceae bacterium]
MLSRINLVPQLPVSTRIRKLKAPLLALLAGAMLLFFSLENRLLDRRLESTDRDLAEIEREISLFEQLQAQVQALTTRSKALEQEKQKLEGDAGALTNSQTAPRRLSLALLKITEALPPTVKCQKIEFGKDAVQLHGVAMQYRDLPPVIKALKEDPLFKAAQIQDIDRVEGDHDRLLFTIVLALE